MEHQLDYLLAHYGYFGIVLALVGGIVGLPLPDEIVLTYVGYNIYQGKMLYALSVVSAVIGALTGITISYLLGIKLGSPFLKKFGPKIHITEKKIERTQALFNKFGPFLLFIGYFIPGVRHVTAYLAGISCLGFRKFALYAYAGGVLWIFTFITLGRVLGHDWKKAEHYIHPNGGLLVILVVVLVFLVFLYRKRKKRSL
ncbi:membrane protein DedA with SNARE-associated domain [Aneurinibacillus soli]|uniref:Inner membrane protein YqjA n=1 Tax=Aneurinibacillus soli TaxID=1500254 RepID=A0A0U5C5A0_9BACL|nr:DedA family protein [Aneurinibacillus soli]PYE62448.1 membrane protein DedA with SNARE-associated domain [Aneurinibacillus soli]BAU27011.1 Inner membrane protein YqjA [Aneurinibacillus soli]